MIEQTHPQLITRDLGDGLLMRQATPDDAEQVAEFNMQVHGEDLPNKLDRPVGVWTRDLMTRPHPTMRASDVILVIDTQAGDKLVSTLNTIPQTWAYEGIPFKVGRPELVGTLPAYRGRGLVRAQFAFLHELGVARGEMAQVITGIPHYYRQFGYEMCLGLGGSRIGYTLQLPKLGDGQAEPYTVRPATYADIPFLQAAYDEGNKRYAVAAVRDEAIWQYDIDGRTQGSPMKRIVCVVETLEGQLVGFFAHTASLWGNVTLGTTCYEVVAGASWAQITPSVVRYMAKVGAEYAERDTTEAEKHTFEAFMFQLGASHPVYEAFGERLPRVREPYAWYVRIPDLLGFLRHITPALETRLAASLMAGHTGAFNLNFFRRGITLKLDKGKLSFEEWRPANNDDGDLSMTALLFLHLVFCNRTMDELAYIFPDAFASPEMKVLLNAIFPRRPGCVWGIG
jgi:hypothetical protein